MKFISRFPVLLAEKEMREKRRISLKKASDESGVSIYTIRALADNSIREMPIEALERVCYYLSCTPNDLLVEEKAAEDQISNNKVPLLQGF